LVQEKGKGMKPNRLVILGFLLAVGLAGSSAYAGTTALNDWCFNVNGNINLCNGGSGLMPGGANIAAFDTTLSPLLNNLGTATFTLGPGNGQFVLAYMDYDLDYATLGSFTDYGSVVGSLPSGFSWELDDPNVSNIFGDFAGNTLTKTNNVGAASGAPNICCDVTWVLGIGNINVGAGQTGTVNFLVSNTAPASGFYLQQTNSVAGDSIFMSATAKVTGGTAPEPEMLALLGIGLVALFGARKFRA